MNLLLSIYFFIIAIIQAGLLMGVYHYYRAQDVVKPSPYWLGSLLASVVALFIFGGGIIIIKDIATPEFNFTVGNTLFYVAAVMQALFCRSLNQDVSKGLKIFFNLSIIAFFLIFEWLRQTSNFEVRTAFMCVLASMFYLWQIYELRKRNQAAFSSQLRYLQYASFGELFFAMGRLAILLASTMTIRQVEQIPQILILFTISQLVMNTLSYIAIGSYWSEQIAVSNAQSKQENEQIKALLVERESLITSLLRANKTASTGALSASIAHELNQPLGASSLNIQFLQKKLAAGQLSPELQNEILNTLLADNQRAANTVRTLRSIFTDDDVKTTDVDLGQLIQTVCSIAKPEFQSQNIQLSLEFEKNLILSASRGELQQVMLNLINNAIQALEAVQRSEKHIWIKGAHSNQGIQISIADNGVGISPDAKTHLFELLSSTKSSGMGLGLWLCKHIISRHGGKIWLDDNSSGGAKFTFWLPISS
jgi:signal transduction histidine kinase